MKNRWVLMAWTGLIAVVAWGEDIKVLKTPKQRYSYALGADFGNQLRQRSVDVDASLFTKGLQDILSGGKALLTEDGVKAAIAELQAELKARQLVPVKINAPEELETARAFLAENGKKEGVVTLPSGLQYQILKAGDGKKPTDGDAVVCHYRGTLIDGTEFDSSHRKGPPATLPVNGVIPGWREGLKLMAVGSRYQFFIPPELAYGAYGFGSTIGPNAALIFEVELLTIQQRDE
jgi:FKBP-type peptidyl-prolyl cis-trans isomerase